MILIKVVSAQLTRDTEFFSNMDPYCILKLGGQTQKTMTKNEAGKKPVWNESFRFTNQDNNLKVIVMDEDTASDDTVGEGTANLTKFRTIATETEQIVQLYYKGKAAGKVMLRISNGGTSQPGNNQFQQPNVQPNNWGNQPQNNQWGNQQQNNQNNQWGGNQPQNNQWGGNQPPNNQWGGNQPQTNQWGGNQPSNNQWGGNTQPQNNNGWNQQQGGNQWGNNQVKPNVPPTNNNQWGNQGSNNQWGNNNQPPINPIALINPNNIINSNSNNQGNLYPDLEYKAPINNNQMGYNNVPPNNQMGYNNPPPNYNNPPPNNLNLPFQLIGGMQGLLQPNSNSSNNIQQGGNPYV